MILLYRLITQTDNAYIIFSFLLSICQQHQNEFWQQTRRKDAKLHEPLVIVRLV